MRQFESPGCRRRIPDQQIQCKKASVSHAPRQHPNDSLPEPAGLMSATQALNARSSSSGNCLKPGEIKMAAAARRQEIIGRVYESFTAMASDTNSEDRNTGVRSSHDQTWLSKRSRDQEGLGCAGLPG